MTPTKQAENQLRLSEISTRIKSMKALALRIEDEIFKRDTRGESDKEKEEVDAQILAKIQAQLAIPSSAYGCDSSMLIEIIGHVDTWFDEFEADFMEEVRIHVETGETNEDLYYMLEMEGDFDLSWLLIGVPFCNLSPDERHWFFLSHFGFPYLVEGQEVGEASTDVVSSEDVTRPIRRADIF